MSKFAKFTRKLPPISPPEVSPQLEQVGSYPHRDVTVREPEGQITIRAKVRSLEAFREMCRVERRTYGDMLDRLMERYGPPEG